MLKQVQVTVTESSHAVVSGLAKFAAATKQALADGWQTDKDLPQIMTAALTELVPALQKVNELGPDAKEHAPEFYAGVLVGAKDLVSVLLPPKAP